MLGLEFSDSVAVSSRRERSFEFVSCFSRFLSFLGGFGVRVCFDKAYFSPLFLFVDKNDRISKEMMLELPDGVLTDLQLN